MHILITGGTGLIGTALIENLTADNHTVTILSRNPHKYTFPPGVQGAQWDAQTAAGWGHLVNEADGIINLAGESIVGTGLIPQRWTPEQKKRIYDSRLHATQAVTAAIEQATSKPGFLIQASAIGYYGPSDDKILTETAPPGHDFLATVCQDWEAASAVVDSMGVRRVVTRIGLVLSTDGGPLPPTLIPFKLFVGGPLGSGQQWWSWIHIDDIAQAIRFLIEQDEAAGAFNLTAPNPLTNKQFSQVIGQVLNRPAFMPAPAIALKLALGEMATILLDGQRVTPQRLQDLGYTFQFETAQAALTDLLG